MRARNMQSLTDAIKRRHPGVVIYGIGDEAHKLRTSDHNEDDTAGSRAAQSDADSNPEHRAIDVMLGPAFTRAQAYALIDDLLADPAARARLFYLIFDEWIWSRSDGWAKKAFTGDPHDDHVHASGWAADDENSAGWPAVEGDDMSVWASQVIESWSRGVDKTAAGKSVEPVKWRVRDEKWQAKTDATLAAVLAAVQGDADAAQIMAHIDTRLAELRVGLVADVLAALPDGPLSADDVEVALRRVLGGVDGATPPAGS